MRLTQTKPTQPCFQRLPRVPLAFLSTTHPSLCGDDTQRENRFQFVYHWFQASYSEQASQHSLELIVIADDQHATKALGRRWRGRGLGERIDDARAIALDGRVVRPRSEPRLALLRRHVQVQRHQRVATARRSFEQRRLRLPQRFQPLAALHDVHVAHVEHKPLVRVAETALAPRAHCTLHVRSALVVLVHPRPRHLPSTLRDQPGRERALPAPRQPAQHQHARFQLVVVRGTLGSVPWRPFPRPASRCSGWLRRRCCSLTGAILMPVRESLDAVGHSIDLFRVGSSLGLERPEPVSILPDESLLPLRLHTPWPEPAQERNHARGRPNVFG
eukprot:2579191-Rhodomonas_salina.3